MKRYLFLTVLAIALSCKKDKLNPLPPPIPTTVIDADGNEYAIIVIGTQTWMAENLRTTKYCNGDLIPNVQNDNDWMSLTTGAWSHYENDSLNEDPYGKLYNWYTVDDSRNICPCGWHVPTDADWMALTDYLGGDSIAGGKMKITGTEYWESPNTDATNESGFSGQPGGSRFFHGSFYSANNYGEWWSSTETSAERAWMRRLRSAYGFVERFKTYKEFGLSVRCIKD